MAEVTGARSVSLVRIRLIFKLEEFLGRRGKYRWFWDVFVCFCCCIFFLCDYAGIWVSTELGVVSVAVVCFSSCSAAVLFLGIVPSWKWNLCAWGKVIDFDSNYAQELVCKLREVVAWILFLFFC